MSLKQKTISNVKWSFVESISLKAIGFVLGIILARLLTPADFGLLAIVNVFYLLVTLFIDGGLKEALVQKKDATEKDYSTVFWLNLIIGFFLYALLFLSAPFIQDFYQYDNLAFYIRLQSLTLIIESFGVIQIAKATKDLNLKKITKARIPASLLSFGVGIFMAYHGYGIISLITQQLVSTTLYVLLLLATVKYKPQFRFDFNSAKDLYRLGLKILSMSLISRFYAQSLNLIYAKFYSPQQLGLNNKSSTIQSTSLEIINSTFLKGVYPTYVLLQDNTQKLREIFLFNIKILVYLMILINGIFFFLANEIVLLLLGSDWLGSVIYLKIISAGSLLQPIAIQSQNIFKVRNKVGQFLKMEIINKIVTMIVVFILVSYIKFPQMLMIVLGINLIFTLINFNFIGKDIGCKNFKFLKTTFLNIILFSVAGYYLHWITSYTFAGSSLLNIILFTIVYFMFWISTLLIFERKLILNIKNIIKK